MAWRSKVDDYATSENASKNSNNSIYCSLKNNRDLLKEISKWPIQKKGTGRPIFSRPFFDVHTKGVSPLEGNPESSPPPSPEPSFHPCPDVGGGGSTARNTPDL